MEFLKFYSYFSEMNYLNIHECLVVLRSNLSWGFNTNMVQTRIAFSTNMVQTRIAFSTNMVQIRIAFSTYMVQTRIAFSTNTVQTRIAFSTNTVQTRIAFSTNTVQTRIAFILLISVLFPSNLFSSKPLSGKFSSVFGIMPDGYCLPMANPQWSRPLVNGFLLYLWQYNFVRFAQGRYKTNVVLILEKMVKKTYSLLLMYCASRMDSMTENSWMERED